MNAAAQQLLPEPYTARDLAQLGDGQSIAWALAHDVITEGEIPEVENTFEGAQVIRAWVAENVRPAHIAAEGFTPTCPNWCTTDHVDQEAGGDTVPILPGEGITHEAVIAEDGTGARVIVRIQQPEYHPSTGGPGRVQLTLDYADEDIVYIEGQDVARLVGVLADAGQTWAAICAASVTTESDQR